jgi:NADH-quinone oxidoreductase subunit N
MGSPAQAVRDLTGILPILWLWGAAFVIVLAAPILRRSGWNRLSAPLGGIGVLGGLLLHLQRPVVGFETPLFVGNLVHDTLYVPAMVVLLVSGFIAVLIAQTYLRVREIERPEYYALVLLALSGAALMLMASDLVVLFLGLELMSFALYVLAGFARTDPKSDEAALKYFLLGAFASALLLYGIMLTYAVAASTHYDEIQSALAHGALKTPMGIAAAILLMIGLCFKVGAVPFHQWSPDVYEGAPTSATAFLATTAKIAAFVAFLRLFDALSYGHGAWLPALRTIALVTMVVGNLLAIAQTNVKRMLAYSGIAHAGYLLIAVVCVGLRYLGPRGAQASTFALTATVFYLLAYALAFMGAFAVLSYLSRKDRDVQGLSDLRGLATTQPSVGYAMVIFMLSLAGIPATAGFVAKWQVFYAILTGGDIGLTITMALASAMGLYYYLRVAWYIVFDEPQTQAPDSGSARAKIPGGAGAAIVICALCTVLLGLVPGAITGFLTVVR